MRFIFACQVYLRDLYFCLTGFYEIYFFCLTIIWCLYFCLTSVWDLYFCETSFSGIHSFAWQVWRSCLLHTTRASSPYHRLPTFFHQILLQFFFFNGTNKCGKRCWRPPGCRHCSASCSWSLPKILRAIRTMLMILLTMVMAVVMVKGSSLVVMMTRVMTVVLMIGSYLMVVTPPVLTLMAPSSDILVDLKIFNIFLRSCNLYLQCYCWG